MMEENFILSTTIAFIAAIVTQFYRKKNKNASFAFCIHLHIYPIIKK